MHPVIPASGLKHQSVGGAGDGVQECPLTVVGKNDTSQVASSIHVGDLVAECEVMANFGVEEKNGTGSQSAALRTSA